MSYYYKYYKYKQKYNNLLGGSEYDCGNCGDMFCEICASSSSKKSLVEVYPESATMETDAVSDDQSLDNNIKCCGVFNHIQRGGALCALHACNNLLQSMDLGGEDMLKLYCEEEMKSHINTTDRYCTGDFIDTVVYEYLMRRSELCKTGDGKDFYVRPEIQPFFKFNTHRTSTVLEDYPELVERLTELGYPLNQIKYGLERTQTFEGLMATFSNQKYEDDVAVDDEYLPIWKLGFLLPVDEQDLLQEFTDPEFFKIYPNNKSLLGYIIKVPGHYIAIRLRNSDEADCKQYCFIDSIGNYIKNGDATDMIRELKTHSKCWGKSPFEDDNIQQLNIKPMVIKVLSDDY